MTTNTIKSALQEAYEKYGRVGIPEIYLQSLYFAQFFEFSLEQLLRQFIQVVQKKLQEENMEYAPKISETLTSKDYLVRIETFLPRSKNNEFYTALEDAMKKRNAFIHQSFKVNGSDGSPYINVDMKKFYLEKNSLRLMREWLHAFRVANSEILKITERFLKE